jgi:hypothetical protein
VENKNISISLIIDLRCQININIKIRSTLQGIRTHWDHCFIFLLLWYNHGGNHLEENIAKFGHKTCRTFQKL